MEVRETSYVNPSQHIVGHYRKCIRKEYKS